MTQRFKLDNKDINLSLLIAKVSERGLSAAAQAESIRFKLLGGVAVRRACTGVMKFVMQQEATGVEIVISGKIRAQRAKAMK